MTPIDPSTANQLVVPVSWVLGIIGTLGTIIATLATIIWKTLTQRLEIQDHIIEKLQNDVDRLSEGCGHENCLWKRR